MSRKEKTLRETIEDAWDYQIALAEESDRAVAVLAAAYFEEWLRDEIIGQFVEVKVHPGPITSPACAGFPPQAP